MADIPRIWRFATRHPWHVAWAAIAAANLALGVYLSIQPDRTGDLLLVASWARSWLHGVSPYAGPWAVADYPPQALLALSPLALVPEAWLPAVWTSVNLVLAPLLAWLAVGLAPPRDRERWALLALVLLSCDCVRTLNQFTLLVVLAGLGAMHAADRRPIAGGLLLALALIKPQVAGPFALWALLTRRYGVVAVAVAATAAAILAFALRIAQGPAALLADYLVVIQKLYASDDRLTGTTGLQPVLHAVVSSFEAADAAFMTVALALLAWVVVLGWRAGRTRSAPAIAAAAGLWSLATFRFLSYGLVLAFPAVVLLAGNDDTSPWPRADRWVFRVMVARLVLSIPAVWRHFLDQVTWLDAFDGLVLNIDRGLVAFLLVYLLLRLHAQMARAEG